MRATPEPRVEYQHTERLTQVHLAESSAETISRGTAAVSTIAGGAALGAALGLEGAAVGALIGAAIAVPPTFWKIGRSKHHGASSK